MTGHERDRTEHAQENQRRRTPTTCVHPPVQAGGGLTGAPDTTIRGCPAFHRAADQQTGPGGRLPTPAAHRWGVQLLGPTPGSNAARPADVPPEPGCLATRPPRRTEPRKRA